MPAEYSQGVVAYILSTDADKHIEWMKNVLGGVEKFTFRSEDGKKAAYAEIAINGGCLYITDLSDDKTVKAVNDISVGSTATQNGGDAVVAAGGARGFILHVEVENPNDMWKKAIDSGCTVEMDLKVQSWGCLYGMFRDPFGFAWALCSPETRKRGVVPYILTPGGECQKQIDWLKEVYGAQVKEKFMDDGGSMIGHCGVEINGYTIYFADQNAEAVESLKGKPRYFHCHLEIPNPEAVWEKAMKNGAKTIGELKTQFWGALLGTLEDPFGSRWSLAPIFPGPANRPGVVTYLLSPNCQQHIDFIKTVFDGKVKTQLYTSDEKKIMHCTMEVNGGDLCLSDQHAEWHKSGEACGFVSHLDLSDPDAVWKKAMENGCDKVMELKQQFWGEYYGVFKDPLGYVWSLRKEF